ncbi:hypothetical protein CMK22_02235 [Candidatus Poribacteria bacterium]|nr:hypothetical protein [Candidatus Poribacteria bacterium]
MAVRARQSKMVKFLIQQRADVNTKNGDGEQPHMGQSS